MIEHVIDQIQSIFIFYFLWVHNSLYTCLIHVFILAHNHVFIPTTSQHE